MGAVRITESSHDQVGSVIDDNGQSPDALISILQDIQTEYHYLPEEALRHVAQRLNLPLIQVYGVATFFKAFSLKPQGKHKCSVCLGTACHVRGAPAVLGEVERQLGVKSGDTTEDMMFTLESVNCLGACALGPVAVIDGVYHGQMNVAKAKKIIGKHRQASRQEKDEKVAHSS
jgi:NADH:ubiquinone oxidoreductase subunit E